MTKMKEFHFPAPVSNITDMATRTRNLDAEGLGALRTENEALKRFPEETHKFFGRPLKDVDFVKIDQLVAEGKIPPAGPELGAVKKGASNEITSLEKIDKNIYAAGCYNGSGIGVGTFFGEQIALKVFNQQTDEISVIEERKKPNWLLPQPLLNIGIYTRLTYERIKARSET